MSEKFEIAVVYNGDTPMVSGRDLHEALEVQTPYKKWFDRMSEYGFKEGKDFWTILSESTGGRPSTEHYTTINMAKELCMLARTERGKEARLYFINIEEEWRKEQKANQPSYLIDDPAERAERWAKEYREKRRLETQVIKLETKIENDAPMVEFAKALADSDELLTVGEFACIVNQALAVSFTGVSVGRNQMFEILRENGYLISQKSMRNAPSSFMSKNDYMRIVKVYSDRDRRYNPETRITHSGAMYLFKSLRNQFRKESKSKSCVKRIF